MSLQGVQRAPLTAENLRRLEPSLIRPMPPVSISSGDDDNAGDGGDDDNDNNKATDDAKAEDHNSKVARLRTWVYNAMQTLVGLGDEGREILDQDELVITGLGQIGLRPGTPHGAGMDVSNTAYLAKKLAYLEDKCKPLSQARRRRRRMATREEARAEDAARALAEAKAAEGHESETVGVRGGYFRPHQEGKYEIDVPRVHSAFPVRLPPGLHGRAVDDGMSYYYETLRMLLEQFLDNDQAEAFLQHHACGDSIAVNDVRYFYKIADTATMGDAPRMAYLNEQGHFISRKLDVHLAALPMLNAHALITRYFPTSDSCLHLCSTQDDYTDWCLSASTPRRALRRWFERSVALNRATRHILIDYVEASQGALFRMWLDVAPDKVAEVLANGAFTERVYICKLLAAALLDVNQARDELATVQRRYHDAPSPSREISDARLCDEHSFHNELIKRTLVLQDGWRSPSRQFDNIWKWLDGISPPCKEQLGHQDLDDASHDLDSAAERNNSPRGSHRNSSGGSSIVEITGEEFAKSQQSEGQFAKSQQSQGQKSPNTDKLVWVLWASKDEQAQQRGGQMDEPEDEPRDGPGDEPEDEPRDEPEDEPETDPELPPAKRMRLEGQLSPYLKHDQSVHERAAARSKERSTEHAAEPKTDPTTEPPTDTSTPQTGQPASTNDTPQSSASSAPTPDVANTEGKSEMQDMADLPAALGKRWLEDIS